ncbi:MAG: thermosome subunit, partial [Candidatus Odinarchaeota archaeon]|nr:thermosome subunit [Candidatus Odinarchaeota archaeon]
MSLSGIPVLILEKDTKRTHGRNALQSNIMAATAIAEMVRSSLGPRGMDKMLVDSIGDVTITNDGAEILKKIEVRHPAAKIIIQASKTQDDEAGDGTTTVVVVAGELLKQAQLLLEKGIHPSIIIKGYRLAAEEALKYLNEIAIEAKDDKTLMNVAKTTMNSKIISGFKDYLAKLVVDAVKQVAEEVDGTIKVDLNFIKIIKKEGEDISSTQLVKGVVIDKELKNDNMAKLIRDAKIAIVNPAIKLEKTELDANIRISSPEDIIAFKQKEEELVRSMIEKIKAIGANVILCQREIDDLAAGMMAKYNIMGVQNVAKRDL